MLYTMPWLAPKIKCGNAWTQVDDELLARKLQEEESAKIRKNTRKPPSKQPVVCYASYLAIFFFLSAP